MASATFPGRCLLLALLLVGCCAAPVAAKVVIGVAGPTEGASAETTRQIADAARRGAARFNREGGILGEPIEVVEVDDQCAPGEAEAAARTLIAKGAMLVLGHPCAGAAVAAAKVYAQAGTLFIATATRHPALTSPRAGPTIFRAGGRDDRQGASAGALLARLFAGKPVAIVHDGSHYAEKTARSAAAAMKAAGQAQVVSVEVDGGKKDFTPVIAKLVGAKSEALFYAGFPIEAGLLLRQMRNAGLTSVFIGSDTLADAQFAETAGDMLAGAGVLLPLDPARHLMAAAKAAFPGEHPGGAFLAAYAAVEGWHAAVQAAQATVPAAVAAALQAGRFDTVTGALAFDVNGDADVPSYDIVWWKDGALALRD